MRASPLALAQAPQEIKVGVVASMSGVYGVGGKQLQNGINAFLKLNGDEVATWFKNKGTH